MARWPLTAPQIGNRLPPGRFLRDATAMQIRPAVHKLSASALPPSPRGQA